MSDLEDIAAAAGIAIVDAVDDGGDIDCQGDQSQATESFKAPELVGGHGDAVGLDVVRALEEEFNQRYTEEDPDYVKTMENFDTDSRPPCIKGYSSRRSRDFVPNRNRGQGYHSRDYRGRGNYRDQRGNYPDQRGDYRDQRGDYRDRRDRSRGYEDRRYEQNSSYRYDDRSRYGRRDWDH